MSGSAKMTANTRPRTPATNPASAPRRMMRISIGLRPYRSVAGKAEEVPGVVYPLVDDHRLAEDAGHALVHAHEVVDGQGQEERDAQDQCDPPLGQRFRRDLRLRNRARGGDGNARHGMEPA